MSDSTLASTEYAQLRQDIKDLSEKVDEVARGLVTQREYDANNKAIITRVEALESAQRTLASNRTTAGWNVLGYIVMLASGGSFVAVVEWLTHVTH